MPQYQGVWTLEQQAQALTNQQWVTDPNFNNTTLLLQADGTGSGSQNQTFLDSSTNNFFITRGGNATQGSFSPFSQAPGYWGNYFNGSSSLITPTSSATPLAIGSGDFTIEFWVNSAIPGSDVGIIDNRAADGSSTGLGVGIGGSTGKIRLYSNVELFNAGVITANQFTHVAIVRSSSTGTVYINGISAGTISSWSTNFTDQGFKIGIGSGGNAMTGYISNFRFVKGTAVYTANFTPTTAPLTAITNTSLLTCQSNRFVDNSTNGYAITINGGTPSVQAFGPFAPALQWTPDVVGGSYYGDGTGDGIYFQDTTQSGTSSSFNLGAGNNASVDHWWYPTAAQAAAGFSKQVAVPTDWNGQIWYQVNLYDSGNISFFYRAGANFQYIFSALPANYLNQWNHVAVASDTSNNLSLFFNGIRIATAVATIGLTTTTPNYITFGQQAAGQTASSLKGYMSGLRFIQGSGAYNAASTTITIPTAPPTATATTQLLLNCTNAGIYDGKMANNLETVGNAQVSTSPVKYGSGSMYFPTTNGNYCVSPPNQPNFIYGTGNFTVEAWLYPIAFTNVASGAFGYGLSGGAVDWVFEIDTSGNALWVDNNTVRFYASVSLRAGVWTHVAVVRTNTGTTMYYNGVSVGTYSTINNISGTSGARLYVGTGAQVPGSRQFVGFIDDFRVTKGVARYFTTFTPPQQALPRQ